MSARRRLTVLERREVAAGVVELALGADGELLPEWDPGSHIDLELPGGLTRQYSLTGSPYERRRWTIAVLREPESRGGSAYVHDRLAVDDSIHVVGPRNNFSLTPDGPILFVGGGIGITPLVPMIEQAAAQGREWRLLYGGRTRAGMAYADELALRYGGQVEIRPQDTDGLLDLALTLAEFDATAGPRAAVYACGPEPLLAALGSTLGFEGAGRLHLERFRPLVIERDEHDTPFTVELARSGRSLAVGPGQSILSRITAEGMFAASSCKEGTCGACEVSVLDGEPDHRDSVLSAEEQAVNDCMMICVSRSRTPVLVLDL